MVIGLRDGKIAGEFVGALPEAGVRQFLSQLMPSEAEQLGGLAGRSLAMREIFGLLERVSPTEATVLLELEIAEDGTVWITGWFYHDAVFAPGEENETVLDARLPM